MNRIVAITCLLTLYGCGGLRPATRHAIAVGVGAMGTAIATSAQTCETQSSTTCQQVSISTLVIGVGVALSAGSVAYLESDSE